MFFNYTKYKDEMLIEFFAILKKNNVTSGIVGGIILLLSLLIGFFISPYAFILTFAMLLVILLVLFATMNSKKVLHQSFAMLHNPDVLYEFDDDKIHITMKSESLNTQVDLEYKQILKLVESEKFLFLFLIGEQMYILDKKGMTHQELNRLMNKLYSYISSYNFMKINHNKPFSYYVENYKKNKENLISVGLFLLPIATFLILLASPIGSHYQTFGLFFPVGLFSIIMLSYYYHKTKQKLILLYIIFVSIITMIWILFLVAALF